MLPPLFWRPTCAKLGISDLAELLFFGSMSALPELLLVPGMSDLADALPVRRRDFLYSGPVRFTFSSLFFLQMRWILEAATGDSG